MEHIATNKFARAIDQWSIAVSSSFKLVKDVAIKNNGDTTKKRRSPTLLDCIEPLNESDGSEVAWILASQCTAAE